MNLILLEEDDFLADPAALRACRAGEEVEVELRGRRFEHARDVHRAEPGRELRAGLLGGRVGRAVVAAVEADRMRLRVRFAQEPPPRLPLTLIVALPRPKTLRRVLEAAATLGAARLFLVNAWRVEKSFWRSPTLAPAAIGARLRLGLEQARDTIPPLVETRRLLRPFVEQELDALAAGTRRLVAHPPAATPCPHALAAPITLALGPEAGFIDREIELLARHGFEPVSLGPRPLRVEQALPALVARLT